jgi:hypothetical protein
VTVAKGRIRNQRSARIKFSVVACKQSGAFSS